MKAALAELSTLKASLDGAARGANGQFAKLADRLDRVERAQTEPAAKLAHIADVVDRLEKRYRGGAAGRRKRPARSQRTRRQRAKPKQPDNVLQDWVVQGVQDGRALVESRYGGVFDVAIGSILPGLGRVEAIKRQDGEWIVVTARGMITSPDGDIGPSAVAGSRSVAALGRRRLLSAARPAPYSMPFCPF